jgi:hypothetical protein
MVASVLSRNRDKDQPFELTALLIDPINVGLRSPASPLGVK